MGRAAVRWSLRQESLLYGGDEIPGTEGFQVGDGGWWYEEMSEPRAPVQIPASGLDTLDAGGRLGLRLRLGDTERGRPSRATIEATVTDVNRQTVSASASLVVHPAAFYLGAKPEGESWFWSAGKPASIGVIAVRPDGERVSGVTVEGVVIRREWHQVRRERAGYAELVGEWVSDTVARCSVTSAADARPCRFTPPAGGSYIASFRAEDAAGRSVNTSLYRWAVGSDWVPWNDESQFKMDVVPDRSRYAVGDTATVLFASPFTGAEAWITLEREGLIEQRRMRIESGTTTLSIPITEALAPNVFVSIVVARGRSARPGPLDDPGRPTVRVGYAELRVTPERKRLAVQVAPLAPEYRPGDTARVAIEVRDGAGAGHRSEVTLWAVDEGVLALTGYDTPDPLDLLYRPRGLGMRLASTLTTVTPQVPEGEKGKRAPGGGGGADAADILRSRFQTTAFFLGSLITNAEGKGVASARLPDNLTTFRLMAVAVTAGDRYGSGQSSLLVTRPLVARPALPRFLREGDRFAAGVVVNRREGGEAKANVEARATGAKLEGRRKRDVTLEPGRGREVRFEFLAGPGDSLSQAGFRFTAKSGGDADAVAVVLPVRPPHHPQSFTVAGVLHDSATAELALPDDVDPARSTLHLSLGTSPLAMIRGADQRFRIYPYWCSEQIASAAEPLLALYRAGRELGADSAVARRARRGPRARDRDAGAPPAARRRHRTLERRRLDHAVADCLCRGGAAGREGRRARGGRLGARPARRVPPALARRTGPDHGSRRRVVRQQRGAAQRPGHGGGLPEPGRPARPRRGKRAAAADRAARLGGPDQAGARPRTQRRPRRRAAAVGARVGRGEGGGTNRYTAQSVPPRLLLLLAGPAHRVAPERHSGGESRASAGRPDGGDPGATGPGGRLDLEHAGSRHRGLGPGRFPEASEGGRGPGRPGAVGQTDGFRRRGARRGEREERRSRPDPRRSRRRKAPPLPRGPRHGLRGAGFLLPHGDRRSQAGAGASRRSRDSGRAVV